MSAKIKILSCILAIFLFSANFCYAVDNSVAGWKIPSFAKQAMDYTVNIWQTRVFPYLSDVWVKSSGFLNKEIGNRPDIKNKLESEKKEIGEQVPQLLTPLWDKIKGIIK